jgi:hypothetical protein
MMDSACHFKRVVAQNAAGEMVDGMWQMCSPGDPQAVQMALDDVQPELLADPPLSMMNFLAVVDDCSASVSPDGALPLPYYQAEAAQPRGWFASLCALLCSALYPDSLCALRTVHCQRMPSDLTAFEEWTELFGQDGSGANGKRGEADSAEMAATISRSAAMAPEGSECTATGLH